jgi:hypothetical protein
MTEKVNVLSDDNKEILDIIEQANCKTLQATHRVFYSQRWRQVLVLCAYLFFAALLSGAAFLEYSNGGSAGVPTFWAFAFLLMSVISVKPLLHTQYILLLENYFVIRESTNGLFCAKISNVDSIRLEKKKDVFGNVFMGLIHGPIGYIVGDAMLSRYQLQLAKKDGRSYALDMDRIKVSNKFQEALRLYAKEKQISID